MDSFGPPQWPPVPPNTPLDLLAALIHGLCTQSSALLPAVWSLHRVPAWQQLSTVGLVGRASNPSKLTVWCIYSGSGLSCRRAKWARLEKEPPGSLQAAAALPMWTQQLAMRIYLSANSKRLPVGPAEYSCVKSTLTPALFPAVLSCCQPRLDRATCRQCRISTVSASAARSQIAGLKGVKSAHNQAALKLAAWSLLWVPKSRRRPLPPWLFDHCPRIAIWSAVSSQKDETAVYSMEHFWLGSNVFGNPEGPKQ